MNLVLQALLAALGQIIQILLQGSVLGWGMCWELSSGGGHTGGAVQVGHPTLGTWKKAEHQAEARIPLLALFASFHFCPDFFKCCVSPDSLLSHHLQSELMESHLFIQILLSCRNNKRNISKKRILFPPPKPALNENSCP